MSTSKEDRSFKTLINRETTDSVNKFFFNELGADTINVHSDDLWAETIPDNDPSAAVTAGVAELRTLQVLTEDPTVPNQQAWKAVDPPGTISNPRLRDWISTKYGAAFQVRLFDGNDNEIFTTDPINWFFAEQTGILTFDGDVSAIPKPFKITGYRYTGLKGAAAATGGSGWIYIEDITVPGGSTSGQVYQDPPGNTVLDEVTVSALTFNVDVKASYPLVNVAGVDETLSRDPGGGFYSGTVSVTVAGAGDITALVKDPDGGNGATDITTINVELPPAITQLNFTGPYPTGPGGLQTELKEDDSFDIEVAADKQFDLIEIQDFGASKFISIPVGATVGPITVQIQAADRGDAAQLLSAQVRVRDASTGAFSSVEDTNSGGGGVDGTDVVNLNNLRPTGTIGIINYPGGQQAIKNVEQATVNHTANDFNSVQYTDPTGTQIIIANDTTFEAAKQVTCQNPGIFNNSTNNFRYVLTRNANGSQLTVNGVVVVADIAPTIDVTIPATRLRSGGNNGTSPQDHTVTITSNQPLLNAPTLDVDSGGNRGTFQGGGFTGGPSVWTRQIRVDETVPDEKGTFTFENLVATGLAGIDQNTINSGASYTLGGFVQRDLTFAAFATTTSIGTSVEDFSKLTANIFTATNQPALKQPIGTPPPVINGYTINATGVNPTDLIWLDTAAAGANSGGTAQITDVEETP